MIQVPETRSDVQTHSTLRSRVLAAIGSLLIVMSLAAPIPALAVDGATKLAFLDSPLGGTPGSPISSRSGECLYCFRVAVENAGGSVVQGDSTTVISLAIGVNPGSGTIMGTTSRTVVNGVATFNDVSITRVGIG